MPPVQLFVDAFETQLDIEFTFKKPIKTQCKPLTPSPSPRVQRVQRVQGEGSKIKSMWPCAVGRNMRLTQGSSN